MSNNLPLNGERLLNHLEGNLRQSPATALAQALEGIDAVDDAPDGTNGAVKSDPVSRAVDPSQGRGAPQRRSKSNDALLESVMTVINRRIR
ncbi:hypothetical protein FNY88_04200 [Corynebacterium guaraldiae]|uniref:Uncharacterized protein n=1 Tax=Corynebacterium guaraldiae TaxID=3051103 RepID=A0ABY3CV38_9CORY|nr:hypothetical protein [Corynebacterium guaraldiae]TRX49770.1 hypothetical protein FNY88_04200 [Corynebacterium guaraldiae]